MGNIQETYLSNHLVPDFIVDDISLLSFLFKSLETTSENVCYAVRSAILALAQAFASSASIKSDSLSEIMHIASIYAVHVIFCSLTKIAIYEQ